MALLDPTRWPEVRAALDVSLSSGSLPDTVIEYDIYWGAAERELADRIDDVESKTGGDLLKASNAALYVLASLIAPALPSILAGKAQYLSYQRSGVDWDQRSEALRARAENLIADLLTPSETSPRRPTMFATAAGTRGK